MRTTSRRVLPTDYLITYVYTWSGTSSRATRIQKKRRLLTTVPIAALNQTNYRHHKLGPLLLQNLYAQLNETNIDQLWLTMKSKSPIKYFKMTQFHLDVPFNHLTPVVTMGTAIKHPVPDRLSRHLQFLTYGHSDAQPRASQCRDVKNYKWRHNRSGTKCFRPIALPIIMATVGVTGLSGDQKRNPSVQWCNYRDLEQW